MNPVTRRVARLVSATAAIGLTAAPANPVGASHGEYPKADNSDHSIEKHGLTSNGNTGVNSGIDALNCCLYAHATTTGNADVEVYDNYYVDTTWYGLTQCINIQVTECDDWDVYLNQNTLPNDSGVWKAVSCHEFGHTVGLGHRTPSSDTNNDSCMRTNIFATGFDSHDDDQISV